MSTPERPPNILSRSVPSLRPVIAVELRRPFFAGKKDGNYGLSRMCTPRVRQRYNFPVNVFPHAKVAHTYTNGAPGGSSPTPAPAASMRLRSACIKVAEPLIYFLHSVERRRLRGCNDAREKTRRMRRKTSRVMSDLAFFEAAPTALPRKSQGLNRG